MGMNKHFKEAHEGKKFVDVKGNLHMVMEIQVKIYNFRGVETGGQEDNYSHF